MIEATIRQKDSNTHTKFLILPGGGAFPEYNFQIAKEWYDQGLLDESSSVLIKVIIDRREDTPLLAKGFDSK